MSESYQLSGCQLRYYTEYIQGHKTVLNNTPLAYHLKGKLCEPALFKALDDFVNIYHDGSRSYYQEEGGIPYQVTLDKVEVNPLILDISERKQSSEENERQIKSFMADIATHYFDLSCPPLFRFGLIKKSNTEHLLCLNFPHINSDARSALLLIHIISNLYNHYSQSSEAYRHQRPLSMRAYIEDQAKSYPVIEQAKDLQYWKELLSGVSHFKMDFRRQTTSTCLAAESLFFEAGEKTLMKLKKLARQLKTTPFILFAALFSIILYKRFGHKKIVFNYPVGMRTKLYNDTVGCFNNDIYYRFDIDLSMQFSDYVEMATKQRKNTKKHQRNSRSLIQEALLKMHPKANIENFNANISVHEAHLGSLKLDLAGLTVDALSAGQGTLLEDMALGYEITNKIRFKLQYRCAVFNGEAVKQIADDFLLCLKRVIGDEQLVYTELAGLL